MPTLYMNLVLFINIQYSLVCRANLTWGQGTPGSTKHESLEPLLAIMLSRFELAPSFQVHGQCDKRTPQDFQTYRLGQCSYVASLWEKIVQLSGENVGKFPRVVYLSNWRTLSGL